jgi:type II secretory pathway predicted ATPase ExeA
MFLEFYNLKEQPFGVTPDPRYLYLSPTHREALASLFYGVETARGFLSLIARPGMGKTTLLTALQERLTGKADFLFVSQTQCHSRELLRWVLHRLGESESQDLLEMQDKMTQFLARKALAGRRFVLVIDEAQNLDDSVLETVRLLSNCETPSAKLLQILLAGQPQLATKLANPGLEQFRQRIGISSHMSPLSAEETARYIAFRLQVAGSHGESLFSTGALEEIATLSQGIPRNINNLAFGALSLGYATGHKKIGFDLVKEAASDLGMEPPTDPLLAPAKRATLPPVIESTPVLFPPEKEASPIKSFRRQIVALSAAAILLILAGLTISPLRWVRLVAIGRTTLTHLEAEYAKLSQSRLGPLAATHDSVEEPDPAAGTLSAFDSTARPVTPQSDAFKSEVQAPAIEESPVGDIHRASSVSDGSTRSIIIQRGDTLQIICKKYFGSKDSNTVRKLLSLNPSITNPNHVEVGQRIRLPLVPAFREKQLVAKEIK